MADPQNLLSRSTPNRGVIRKQASSSQIVRLIATTYLVVCMIICFSFALILQILCWIFLAPLFYQKPAIKEFVLGRLFHGAAACAAFVLNPFWRLVTIRHLPKGYRPSNTLCMINHLSGADPWIVAAALFPWELKFIYRGDLTRIPILGWSLALSGDLPIDFTRAKGGWGTAPGSIAKLMKRTEELQSLGFGQVIFPEGTRSKTGRLQLFKDGFFRYAVEHDCEILPCILHNTNQLWPMGSSLVDTGTAYFVFGDPTRPKEGETAERLKERIRNSMLELLRLAPTYDPVTDVPLNEIATSRGQGLNGSRSIVDVYRGDFKKMRSLSVDTDQQICLRSQAASTNDSFRLIDNDAHPDDLSHDASDSTTSIDTIQHHESASSQTNKTSGQASDSKTSVSQEYLGNKKEPTNHHSSTNNSDCLPIGPQLKVLQTLTEESNANTTQNEFINYAGNSSQQQRSFNECLAGVVSASPSAHSPTEQTNNDLSENRLFPSPNGVGLLRATHPAVRREDLAKKATIRLFCGGLSYEVDETVLQNHFCQFGDVIDTRVAREVGTGRHRGFGFVAVQAVGFSPANPDDLNIKLLEDLKDVLLPGPHDICGRRATVQEENRAGNGASGNKWHDQKASLPTSQQADSGDSENRIFVAGLDPAWEKSVLQRYFSQFGEVIEVYVVTDQNGMSRSFAFVTFKDATAARVVCEGGVEVLSDMGNGHKRKRASKYIIEGKEITVREAEPKRARQKSPTQNMGQLTYHHHNQQQQQQQSPYNMTPQWYGAQASPYQKQYQTVTPHQSLDSAQQIVMLNSQTPASQAISPYYNQSGTQTSHSYQQSSLALNQHQMYSQMSQWAYYQTPLNSASASAQLQPTLTSTSQQWHN